MDVRALLGKRCLMKMTQGFGKDITEFRIVELSPSGNWIKLMNLSGNKFWKPLSDVALVEELIDLKAERLRETGEV